MGLSEFEDCLKKEMLRKTAPSMEKAVQSIEKSKKWLSEARKNLDAALPDSCIVSCYSAMFHACRALLFRDGFREKSHFCLARYVEEKYTNTGKLPRDVIEILDYYRDIRHRDLYDTTFSATKEEALEAVENAKMILDAVSKFLGID